MAAKPKNKVSVLFVCMGNICRSPTAHGIFAELVMQHGMEDTIEVDSAGTHAYHLGDPPDPRSRKTATNRGYDLSKIRARRVAGKDFEKHDYILAMDRTNLSALQVKASIEHRDKLQLFLNYHPSKKGEEVPDPYSKEAELFDVVFDLVEEGCFGLLKAIRKTHHF